MLRDNLPDFSRLMPCDGVGLWMNGALERPRHHPAGLPRCRPSPASSRSVAERRVWATHALVAHHPAAEAYHGEVSGLLAIPLSQLPRDYLFFFRKELVHTLDWAGNPRKVLRDRPARRPAHPAQELRDLEGDGRAPGPALDRRRPRHRRGDARRHCRDRAPPQRDDGRRARQGRHPPAHAERGTEPPGQEHPRRHQLARRPPGRGGPLARRLCRPRCAAASRRSPTRTTRSHAATAAARSPTCSAPSSGPIATAGRHRRRSTARRSGSTAAPSR